MKKTYHGTKYDVMDEIEDEGYVVLGDFPKNALWNIVFLDEDNGQFYIAKEKDTNTWKVSKLNETSDPDVLYEILDYFYDEADCEYEGISREDAFDWIISAFDWNVFITYENEEEPEPIALHLDKSLYAESLFLTDGFNDYFADVLTDIAETFYETLNEEDLEEYAEWIIEHHKKVKLDTKIIEKFISQFCHSFADLRGRELLDDTIMNMVETIAEDAKYWGDVNVDYKDKVIDIYVFE